MTLAGAANKVVQYQSVGIGELSALVTILNESLASSYSCPQLNTQRQQ